MNKICCIIDMEGFTLKISKNNGASYKTEFFLRELGYVRIGKDEKYPAKSHRFNLRGHLNMKECLDGKTLHFQSKKILGLPVFSTQNEDAENYNKRFEVIRNIYEQCRQDDFDVVAYKGGSWEKTYLQDLEIPCINLEDFGCPKYKDLLGNGAFSDCGHHILAERNSAVHCSEAEVTAFRDWLVNQEREE